VLSQQWYQLTKGHDCAAKVVFIQKVYGKRGVANYLAKYMGKAREAGAGNYSWSWDWVWKGFVADWEGLKKAWRSAVNGYDNFAGQGWHLPTGWLLNTWRWHLEAGIPP